jgi:metallo-beta-lactamase family protein
MGVELRFLGGARTVTGSRFLVETGRARVLVECGLYQGLKELRLRNWEPFPADPASIDAVVLTHAHVDHSGWLPALHAHGYAGLVHTTRFTAELCDILLRDSARLQEEEAEYANRKGYSKHRPALPLYTERDAEAVLTRFQPLDFRETREIAAGVRLRLRPAGHILGAASVELEIDGQRRLGVSGDVGRPSHPLLVAPEPMGALDALLVESTYGNRDHPGLEAVDAFARAIARTAARGGVAVIPAFAVDRTEVVLVTLRHLERAGRIPRLPIYVDSPMALAALRVYRRAIAESSDEIRPELRGGPDPFDTGLLTEARSVEESREINQVEGPAIIVSASGMATGGRVLHHLERRLPDPRNSIVLVGWQAQGTRGWRLLKGERTLKMHGKLVPVRAEVADIGGFSVHADRDEILDWLRSFERPPARVYAVHGEPEAAQALAAAVSNRLGWRATVPELLDRIEIR